MSYKATMSKKVQVNEKKFCKMCFDAKREGYDTHYLKDFTGPEVKIVCPYLLALQCNYCKEQGHTISYCPILKMKGTKPAKHETRSDMTTAGAGAGTAAKRIYSLRADEDQTPYPTKDWVFDGETYIRIPPPPRLVRQNAIIVEKTPKIKTNTKTQGNVKTTNAYESLFDSDSELEEDIEIPVPSIPAAAAASSPLPQTESRLWAQIAAKPPAPPAAAIQKKRVQFQTPTQTQNSPPISASAITETATPLPELPSFNLKKKTPLNDAFFKYTTMSNWADESSDEDE